MQLIVSVVLALAEETEEPEKPKEKVLETKVVKEEIISQPRSSKGKKLGIVLLALSFGAAGYGLKTLQINQNYLKEKLTKQYVLKITNHGINEGYTDEVWQMIPDQQRYRLMKEELAEMPLKQSWSIVRPTLENKIKHEFQKNKRNVLNYSKQKAREVYDLLKSYLRGD
jgi:hypothetical protein